MRSHGTSYVLYRGGNATKGNKGLMRLTGSETEAEAVRAIAGVIVRNREWLQIDGAILVYTNLPEPLLVAFVPGKEPVAGSLHRLRTHIRMADALGVYADYRSVEQNVRKLASLLLSNFGREKLNGFAFTHIPRGGMFILAMLSYLLDLPTPAFSRTPDPSTTLVIVDDCALSGARFKEYLSTIEHSNLVFCPLYSHPELRHRIVSEEPRVSAVLSAVDLTDHASDLYRGHYDQWRSNWVQLSENQAYWVGQPDYLCFPWGAPDIAIADENGNCMHSGWQIVPEDRSLKTSSRFSENGVFGEFQEADPGKGSVRCADGVVYAKLEDQVFLVARCGEESDKTDVIKLEESSGVMFRALLEHPTVDDALDAVGAWYGIEPSTLRKDFIAFIEQLSAEGYLQRG